MTKRSLPKKLSSHRRKQIAQLAANKRWEIQRNIRRILDNLNWLAITRVMVRVGQPLPERRLPE